MGYTPDDCVNIFRLHNQIVIFGEIGIFEGVLDIFTGQWDTIDFRIEVWVVLGPQKADLGVDLRKFLADLGFQWIYRFDLNRFFVCYFCVLCWH